MLDIGRALIVVNIRILMQLLATPSRWWH